MWDDFVSTNFYDIPWMCYGDFNCITSNTEKRGGTPFKLNNSILKFQTFIHTHGLMDLGFDGCLFAWTNN